jgi:hypothetical protein
MATRVFGIPRDRQWDPMLAALIYASLVAHFGFVALLHYMDWPREPDVPDQYWHLVPARPPQLSLPVVHSPPAAPVVVSSRGGGGGGGGRRRGLAPGRTGKLAILEALGGDAMHDFLKAGRGEDSFDRLSGVTAGGESAPSLKGTFEIGRNRGADDLRVRGPGGVATGERGGERPVEPDVIIEPPTTVRGGLPAGVILGTIQERIGGLRACYERPLNRNHELHGKLTIRLTIASDGSVESIDLEDDTLHSAEVTGCVRARMSGWRFPPASRPSVFSFPVVFQGEST